MEKIEAVLIATTLMISDFSGVEAMNVDSFQSERVDLKGPIADLPEDRPYFSPKIKEAFDKTWDEKKTLEENQEYIASEAEKCFDWSFKRLEADSDFYLGKFGTFERIFFRNRESSNIATLQRGEELIPCATSKNNLTQVVPLELNTIIVNDFFPVGDAENYRELFRECFSKLVKNPVGCELLRTLIANCITETLPKIVVIPVSGSTEDGSVRHYAADRTKGYVYRSLKDLVQFTLFFPQLFTENPWDDVIECDGASGKFRVVKRQIPVELPLFFEILVYLHNDCKEKCKSVSTIQKRFPVKAPYNYNVFMFGNDAVLHNMLGITERGYDPVNESEYLSHEGRYIRLSYADPKYISTEYGETLQEDYLEVWNKLINSVEEGDLFTSTYEYFLSPNSQKRSPKFGVGSYKCSNIDLKTGERILR